MASLSPGARRADDGLSRRAGDQRLYRRAEDRPSRREEDRSGRRAVDRADRRAKAPDQLAEGQADRRAEGPTDRRAEGHPDRRAEGHPDRRAEDGPSELAEALLSGLAGTFGPEAANDLAVMLAENLASEASDQAASSLAGAIRSALAEPVAPDPRHVPGRQAGNGAGGPPGPLDGPPTRRRYDPPSRRAPDVLFDAARAGVVGLFQVAVVLATLAGIFWLPTWWNMRRDLAAAEVLLDRDSTFVAMVGALNQALAQLERSGERREDDDFVSAQGAVEVAESIRGGDVLQRRCVPEPVADAEDFLSVVQVLCANHTHLETLIELERATVLAEAPYMTGESLQDWNAAMEPFNANADSANALMDSLRVRTRPGP